MCAYKLCKVEFRYWGMQTKIEKFIHEVGEFIIFICILTVNLHKVLTVIFSNNICTLLLKYYL